MSIVRRPRHQEYRLLQAEYPDGLEKKVGSYLREGWTLYGYPVVTYEGHIVQAVTRNVISTDDN